MIKFSNTKLYIYLIGAQALAVLKHILGICRSQQYPECMSHMNFYIPGPPLGSPKLSVEHQEVKSWGPKFSSLWESFSTTKLLIKIENTLLTSSLSNSVKNRGVYFSTHKECCGILWWLSCLLGSFSSTSSMLELPSSSILKLIKSRLNLWITKNVHVHVHVGEAYWANHSLRTI